MESEIKTSIRKGDIIKANKLFIENFDMQKFSKKCMIDHWNEFEDAEKKRFIDLLHKNLQKKMNEKMLIKKNDSDFSMKVVSIDKRENEFHIVTKLEANDRSLKFAINLIKEIDGFRITDYEIEGALLSRNYRGHFNYLMRKYGKNGLFEKMENKLKES